MPSARSRVVTMVHVSHQRAVLGSLPQQAWTTSLPRRLQGGGGGGSGVQSANIVFFQTPSAFPTPGRARGLPARQAEGTGAGLLRITKEPSSSFSRRPAPPPPWLPAAARARVPGRNWLPGPRFPGTRKGEGAEAATIGRVRAKRAARSAKTPRGGEPGPCRHVIGRDRPASLR